MSEYTELELFAAVQAGYHAPDDLPLATRSWLEGYRAGQKNAQAQAGDGEAEYGRGYYDGRKSNIDQVPEFWYEALEKIAQEYEELFIYYKDEREKDGWDSPEHPPILLEVREMLKGFNPPPPASVNQQLPEGYVLVPVEPTEAMIDMGVALAFSASVHGKGGWNHYMKALYRAFIAAAQEQK